MTWVRLTLLVVAACTSEGRIDDPCLDETQCGAVDAVCVAVDDEPARCQAPCTRNGDCGPGARCVTDPDAEEGLCWRTCRDAGDCAAGTWGCVRALDDDNHRYCVIDK